MKQGILILLAFVVLSCTKEKENATQESTPVSLATSEEGNKTIKGAKKESTINITPIESLKLEMFSTYSDDFIGCGCTFFLTEHDKQTQNYIFLDAGDIAMVKLNGVVHTLNYKGESDGVITYANDSVEIKRKTTRTEVSTEMEETSDVEGVLTVTKAEQKLEQKFIGFCGC